MKCYQMVLISIKKVQILKLVISNPINALKFNALVQQLPEISTSSRKFGSHTFHYIDVSKIIEANPDVVLIDELAHTNISKERHLKTL